MKRRKGSRSESWLAPLPPTVTHFEGVRDLQKLGQFVEWLIFFPLSGLQGGGVCGGCFCFVPRCSLAPPGFLLCGAPFLGKADSLFLKEQLKNTETS